MRTAFLMITILSLWSPVSGQNLLVQHNYSRKPLISSLEIYLGAGSAGLIGNPLPVFSFGNGTYGYPQLKRRPAIVAGVFLNHELGKRVFLTVRCSYETKGFIQQLDSISQGTHPEEIITLGTIYTDTYKTDYLTLQMMPQLNLLNNSLFIGLGSYFSILQSTRSVHASARNIIYGKGDGLFNKLEYGLICNIGYYFTSENTRRIFVQATGTYAPGGVGIKKCFTQPKIIMENAQLFNVAEVQLSFKSKVKPQDRPKVNSSKEAYEILRGTWNEDNIELYETFKLLVLNRANKVLGVLTVSQGGVSGTIADPKIIFATALKCAASGIIVAHNHPSGNLQPSQSDIDLTKKLKEGSRLLEIQLLDHLICTTERYYSFADEGLV